MEQNRIFSYLCKKYVQLELMDNTGEHSNNSISALLDGLGLSSESDENGWDSFIYPDNGYIPFCSVCKKVYMNFKSDTHVVKIQMKHRETCLWHDYFVEKIRQLKQDIEISYKE